MNKEQVPAGILNMERSLAIFDVTPENWKETAVVYQIPHLHNTFLMVFSDIMRICSVNDRDRGHKETLLETTDEQKVIEWYCSSFPKKTTADRLHPKEEELMVEKTFTVKTFPETLKIFERFLALLHYNEGSSGVFGMDFDGDGSDKLRIAPAPSFDDYEESQKIVNKSSGHIVIASSEQYYVIKEGA